jgi:D-glycerate 3-kinase
VSEPFAPELAGLSAWTARRRATRSGALVLGIAGAQGTGKSTLAGLLAQQLAREHALRTAVLSLDDLYLTRAERERLARDVHPLLRTRGVPGTHDVALGSSLIAALRAAGTGERVRVPRFDKAGDDRRPPERWAEIEGALGVLIFEGWCLGARPEGEAALAAPLNALERDEDPDGRFRRYVNAQLAGPYSALFAAIDALVFLAAPDLQCSLAWRTQQEHELAAREPGRAVMSDAQLARFVQHYERISRHMLAELPARADALLRLRPDHGCASMTLGEAAS